MRKITSILIVIAMFFSFGLPASFGITETKKAPAKQAAVNVPKIEIAFVFDSKAEKTDEIMKIYKPIIEKSLLPDYKAVFPNDLVFKGDWTEKGSVEAANKALKSRARMIVCFGYWSGEYLKKNKTKNIITVDNYAIRGFSDKFFNPVQQSVNDFVVFKRLVPGEGRTAILLNEAVYKSKSNWNEIAKKGFAEKGLDVDFVIIPVGDDISAAVNSIPSDVGFVYVTQIYNVPMAKRQILYSELAQRKIPTFSSMGREDVEAGALLGTSTKDLDNKLAELVSFNIKNVIKGGTVQNIPLTFVDDNILYYNKDTGEEIGYVPHIRLLRSSVVISYKTPELRDLSTVFDLFESRNHSVQRKKFLISAARRSLAAAYLHYLPTTRIDLGYQTYNHDYAYSYNDVPQKVGMFTFGLDQMIYAPDLVTNIIVKHKKLKFNKAEEVLTEQNMGLAVAQLYVDFAMLKNKIIAEEKYLDDIKSVLAMAKIRKISGKSGDEEIYRFAGEVNNAEKALLIAQTDFDNVKVHMNQLLDLDQNADFDLAPLKVTDPAFFLRDINIIDYVRTPDNMEKFIEMVADEAIYLSPETTKLKAAIAMKKAEMGNYAQKFILPNAKLSVEFGHQFGRDLPYYDYLAGNLFNPSTGQYAGMKQLRQMLGDGKTDVLNTNSARFLIAAQWKPIEGGTKIAEIARCKSELNELKTYLEEVNTEIELNIRQVINRAITKYLCIERSYRAAAAEEENLRLVKEKYISGKVTNAQVVDAIVTVRDARLEAMNSQYEFYKELLWLQRGLASVNWAKASDEAKNFIERIKTELVPQNDINVSL